MSEEPPSTATFPTPLPTKTSGGADSPLFTLHSVRICLHLQGLLQSRVAVICLSSQAKGTVLTSSFQLLHSKPMPSFRQGFLSCFFNTSQLRVFPSLLGARAGCHPPAQLPKAGGSSGDVHYGSFLLMFSVHLVDLYHPPAEDSAFISPPLTSDLPPPPLVLQFTNLAQCFRHIRRTQKWTLCSLPLFSPFYHFARLSKAELCFPDPLPISDRIL
ncbi:hypothetical protein H1C71_026978 [Ictidomys tridecemlineatus]|nr:hypothetical protein H1C71_026978 [Ictidomys tridecemlineatus]